MSYDPVETNRRFAQQRQIPFPILSDENAAHVKRFGILNEDYEPGHRFYSIPHPGMLLVDTRGRVVAKFAEPGFRKRPSLDVVLASAKALGR